MTRYIADEAHFAEVLALVPKVRRSLWIGTANLTGAGIGMKGTGTRNFEAGILTDEPELVEAAIGQFDCVWAGFRCKGCFTRDVILHVLLFGVPD